jgi:hypothetical protein
LVDSQEFREAVDWTPDRPGPEEDPYTLEWLGFPELRIHPMYVLDEEEHDLLTLWRSWHNPMGTGLLPFSGGVAEQPAGVMACFDIMDAAAGMIRERRKPPDTKDGKSEG